MAAYLFVHNLFPAHVSTINGSYWSLALEFQFYLLFPLLLTLARRWGVWRTLSVIVAVQLAYQTLLAHTLDPATLARSEFYLEKGVFGRIAVFYLGIVAAHVTSRGVGRERLLTGRMGGWLSFILLTAGFVGYCTQRGPAGMNNLCWAGGFAALICRAAENTPCHRLLCWKPLTGLGIASYSIYLLHQPLIERAAYLVGLRFKPGSAFVIGLGLSALYRGYVHSVLSCYRVRLF